MSVRLRGERLTPLTEATTFKAEHGTAGILCRKPDLTFIGNGKMAILYYT